MKHIFDKQKLEEAVRKSQSYRQALIYLGYEDSELLREHKKIKKSIAQFGLDTSHFLGRAWNKGNTCRRVGIEKYLNNQQKIGSANLKARLIRDGIKKHVCEVCSNSQWNGKKISIQLHHLDGNSQNNNLANLQIVCPNCHAQTETYCRSKNTHNRVADQTILSNIAASRSINEVAVRSGLSGAYANNLRIRKLIASSGIALQERRTKKRVLLGDPNWRTRPRPQTYKVPRPTKDQLHKLLWEKPTSLLAQDFGVSDVAIAKWCKSFGLLKPPRGHWAKLRAKKST